MKNVIDTKLIMDRMNDNPNMKSLKQSSVASYMRDFASINNIAPLLGIKYAYRRVVDYKVELPENYLEVRAVRVCHDLDPVLFEENKLNASFDNSVVKDKTETGRYTVQNGILFLDQESGIVEVEYKALEVDDYGLPVFPYDGSLMQAIEGYVKWRYYSILSEVKMISEAFTQKAERQYLWYIGQYTNKVEMLSYDEAVAVAHNWQRLLKTRNRNTPGKELPEINNI